MTKKPKKKELRTCQTIDLPKSKNDLWLQLIMLLVYSLIKATLSGLLLLIGLVLGLVLGLELERKQDLIVMEEEEEEEELKLFRDLALAMIIGLELGTYLRKQLFINNIQFIANPSRWTQQFLSNDEEKAAHLFDYRSTWYGDKQPTKLTHFKVWLKTIYYLFYEVWFKEMLDKLNPFTSRIPRR